MIVIRANRTYKARNGDKIGPMRPTTKEDGFRHEWTWTVDGRRAWKTNGSYSDVHPVCEFDLIAEWTDGPVRTVTRTVTEIVDGQYGVLRIRQYDNSCFLLSFDEEHWVRMTKLPSQAAAAVLLELAGALDSAE